MCTTGLLNFVREDMQTSREHPRSTARQSYGIFKDAKVVQVSQEKGGNCFIFYFQYRNEYVTTLYIYICKCTMHGKIKKNLRLRIP